MNLKTKPRYFTLPKYSTSVELLGKPLWIAGNIFMEHYQNLSLTDIEGEVWREIKKFPKYHISNFGRIKSTVNNQKILKQRLNDKGYPTISLGLYKKSQRVHRLVAIEFIHNPLNKPEVNHKDCIKYNNHVGNLEWMYGDENYFHAVENGKCSIAQGGQSVFKDQNSIFAYLPDGTLARRYRTHQEAADELGFSTTFIRNHAIVNASIFGLIMSDKLLDEMPEGEIKHRIPKNYIKKDPSERNYWTNRPKKSVIVTNLLTGDETLFERAKDAQEKYKLSIPQLMKKKKNIGVRGNLQFRYAN
jgi:hypothetical protein